MPCIAFTSSWTRRQKTVDEKTFCPCVGGVNGRRGSARGVWCGNCLWLRMGQNIHEILPLCEQASSFQALTWAARISAGRMIAMMSVAATELSCI